MFFKCALCALFYSLSAQSGHQKNIFFEVIIEGLRMIYHEALELFKYKKIAEVDRVADEIRDEVVNASYDFDTNRFNSFSTSTIVSMSKRL